jgi:hypothetical protein
MAKRKREMKRAAKAPAPPRPPPRRRSEIPPHLTLLDVYGWEPCKPDERWSGLTTRLCDLYETPLQEIDAGDVSFLLRHHVGVEVFLDQAFEWLEQDPLVDTEHYPGDLLLAVLGLDLEHLVACGRATRLVRVAERALAEPRAQEDLPLSEGITRGLDRLRAAPGGAGSDMKPWDDVRR